MFSNTASVVSKPQEQRAVVFMMPSPTAGTGFRLVWRIPRSSKILGLEHWYIEMKGAQEKITVRDARLAAMMVGDKELII